MITLPLLAGVILTLIGAAGILLARSAPAGLTPSLARLVRIAAISGAALLLFSLGGLLL